MLRLLAHHGADCYLRKTAMKLMCQRCATSRRARSRNRSESRMDSQCGIDAMWRDRCDACSCREERGRLTRCRRLCAARRPANRGIARAGIRAATPQSERPSGRRRSRTGGRLRVSPLIQCRATLKITPPPERRRCELRAELWFAVIRSHIEARSVRSVTSAPHQSVQPSNESDDPSAQLDHSVRGTTLLRGQLVQL